MKKVLVILSFILLAAAGANSKPKQLTKFVQILEALKSGYRVNAVIHYKDCYI